MNAISLGDIFHATLRFLIGNRCFTNPGIAIGGTKSKVKNANTVEFIVDGVFGTPVTTADTFIHTDVTVQPVSTTRWYALCLTQAGAGSILRGDATSLPDIPATKTCIGAIKVVTDSSHTFTPGTTLHDAAGITTTYYNLSCVPTSGLPA